MLRELFTAAMIIVIPTVGGMAFLGKLAGILHAALPIFF